LELLAALIEVRLLNFVRKQLNLNDVPFYLWSDSKKKSIPNSSQIAWHKSVKRRDHGITFLHTKTQQISRHEEVCHEYFKLISCGGQAHRGLAFRRRNGPSGKNQKQAVSTRS
uniref:FERM domain-containing protein n=1 Tax=Gongylonema pulchrum TaxID=637853 RepID=A0A183DXM0_9BILA